MIKELENHNLSFFQDDPLYLKYFRNRKFNKNELKKTKKLYKKIDKFCEKTDVYYIYGLDLGYMDDFGYYQITDADRGNYDVWHLGENENEVFIKIINDILFSVFNSIEVHNRKVVEEEYHKRFGDIEYDWLLFPREMALYKWKEYYDGNLPEELIKMYEEKANGTWWNKEYNIFFKSNGDKFVLDQEKTLERKMINDDRN